ncbi:DUF2285 domain-containing protein [Variovorax sp. V213]|uniref:DNA -binding domain-containing protein n=1 Tax=Variovorax sp. V213 TaxID=3065955 RepID=UPI0034E8EBBD
MTKRDIDDLPRAPWCVSAAYFYALDLDGPALAWEYLRRHPRYRAEYGTSMRLHCAWPARWGLRVAEDPRLDAREACPQWQADAEGLLHVRMGPTRSANQGDAADRCFDLWRVPGRKHLTLGDTDFTLTTELHARRIRMSLDSRLGDGADYVCAVPLTPSQHGQLDDFNAQAKALMGRMPVAVSPRTASRSALLHHRALQALDAAQAGASHRDIAKALFGLEAAAARWHADGELRAQVRHLLRRAEAYMRGEYRTLAGVCRSAATCPGDESLH